MDYKAAKDEELVLLAQKENAQATEELLERYKNFVRAKARPYFLMGADREDIVQEGMIGLFKAVRDYRESHESTFHAFADVCVTRQILSAIKAATRQKHIPLNYYISLSKPLAESGGERTLLDVIPEDVVTANPEDLLIGSEEILIIEQRIREALTPFEQQVLTAFLQGKSYQETAEMLNTQAKSVDNALTRVKRKLLILMYGHPESSKAKSTRRVKSTSDIELAARKAAEKEAEPEMPIHTRRARMWAENPEMTPKLRRRREKTKRKTAAERFQNSAGETGKTGTGKKGNKSRK